MRTGLQKWLNSICLPFFYKEQKKKKKRQMIFTPFSLKYANTPGEIAVVSTKSSMFLCVFLYALALFLYQL